MNNGTTIDDNAENYQSGIISQNQSGLDNEANPLDLSQPPEVISRHYDIFISHSSNSSEKSELKSPLQGEEKFVKALRITLIEKFGYSVFLDLEEKIFSIDDVKLGYKNSDFGVFICSPRFNYRYNHQKDGYILKKEVRHFESIESDTGGKSIIPILFGIEKPEFTQDSPFESLDFRIDNYYDDLIKNDFNSDFIVENICLKIDKFIKEVKGLF